MNALVVIPARWGSTRLPGKPLVEIAGRSLLARVIHLARRAIDGDLADLVVATDDVRIVEHARRLGCPAVMTGEGIATGSGRALAAALTLPAPPSFVCNLQGDAPFVPPNTVRLVLQRLMRGDCDCVTPVTRLDWPALDALRRHKLRSPSSGTTCVRAASGRALWFSKTILPHMRDEAALRAAGPWSPVFRHLGLYGYALDALHRAEAAPATDTERIEGLEQLRLLELGMRVETVDVEAGPIAMGGIDTPDDVAMAERLIREHGDPLER